MRVQAAARWRRPGDRFLGPGRLHGSAQRAPAHLGPRLRGGERHHRRRGLGAADDRHLSADAAPGAAILWAASRDEATVVEHLVNVGRRSAIVHRPSPARARPTPAACRARLDSGYVCPLNQYLVADALGLTAIHVNRVLRQLRERRRVLLWRPTGGPTQACQRCSATQPVDVNPVWSGSARRAAPAVRSRSAAAIVWPESPVSGLRARAALLRAWRGRAGCRGRR